jgi:hypothetical protein
VLCDDGGGVEEGWVVGDEYTRTIWKRNAAVTYPKQPSYRKPPVKPSEAPLDNALAQLPSPPRVDLDGSQDRAPDPTEAGRYGVEDRK